MSTTVQFRLLANPEVRLADTNWIGARDTAGVPRREDIVCLPSRTQPGVPAWFQVEAVIWVAPNEVWCLVVEFPAPEWAPLVKL